MADKIQKALRKLSPKEKIWVKEILSHLTKIDLKGLDIKKLKGHSNIFRAKKGRIRVIYKVDAKKIRILTIERRSDNTYKSY